MDFSYMDWWGHRDHIGTYVENYRIWTNTMWIFMDVFNFFLLI